MFKQTIKNVGLISFCTILGSAVIVLNIYAAILPVHISSTAPVSISVCYSPGGNCANFVDFELDKAKTQIRMMAYQLDYPATLEALKNAKKRGVDVAIIIDSRIRAKSYILDLVNAGIPIYSDHKHNIQHQKTIVIDSNIIYEGSFNWTNNAELHNSEI